MPEWSKAWKLDDPKWMKERKAKWKEIKKRLPIVARFLRREDHLQLKNFFIYGHGEHPAPPYEKWERYRYDPNYPLTVEAPVLFECWLTADQSDENYQQILKKNIIKLQHGDGTVEYTKSLIKTSRRRFREIISSSEFPVEGSLFDGLEKRLYYLLGPARCRREDYSEFSDNQYKSYATSSYGFSLAVLKRFLLSSSPNSHDIAQFVLPEYRDSMPVYYESVMEEDGEERAAVYSRQEVQYLAVFADIALGRKTATDMQRRVAISLLECLPLSQLPKIVCDNIEPVLK